MKMLKKSVFICLTNKFELENSNFSYVFLSCYAVQKLTNRFNDFFRYAFFLSPLNIKIQINIKFQASSVFQVPTFHCLSFLFFPIPFPGGWHSIFLPQMVSHSVYVTISVGLCLLYLSNNCLLSIHDFPNSLIFNMHGCRYMS